ncbi:MAG: acyl-CoA dehydrogenase [Xanthobacteraceae bacterium]|nr:MAG: acyl-CoA dehydrogenase [Xanthobacteraceae bacterium]
MVSRDCLDWPFFDDGHLELAHAFKQWATDSLPPLLEGAEEDADAVYLCVRRLVGELGKAGLLRSCVPAAYGGTREVLDTRSLCLARETLGYHSGLADFAFATQGLGSAPISLFGSEEQKRSILPGIAAGTRIGAFALSEPDAGSDVAAISTRARQDGDGWRLNGVKTWISNAGLADYYVVFAQEGNGSGSRGLSAFIVPANTAGLDDGERIDVIAPHPLGTLRLTDCWIPAENRIGFGGDGFRIAMSTLDIFRSTVGATALGLARRAMDEAVGRSLERRMFGQVLADFQMTRCKLGDMAVSIDAAALLVYRAAWTKDVRGTRVTREASTAKLFATEAAQQVIDAAVQLFGGLGVVHGMPVEKLYREIRALRIYEGASEVLKLIIGSKVIEDQRSADRCAAP